MHIVEHGQHTHNEPPEIPPAIILAHMIEHNRSHLTELEEVASRLSPDSQEKIAAAIAAIRSGNEQLASILIDLKE